jgi:hypothetical protein
MQIDGGGAERAVALNQHRRTHGVIQHGGQEAALDKTCRIAELGLRLEADLHPANLGFGVNQPPSQEARARWHGGIHRGRLAAWLVSFG